MGEMPVEVDVDFASQYLGVTSRMVTNYLKADQLKGVKVGAKWFIDSESLQSFRAQKQPLRQVKLPALENPLSYAQQNKLKDRSLSKQWKLKKNIKCHPGRLRSYTLLVECVDLLFKIKSEIKPSEFDFFWEELILWGDDLSAGYYSFGQVKRKLYSRARVRMGRLISRAQLYQAPQGFTLSLCAIVDSISHLCRRLDNKELAK